jgi:hypothetical protein
MNLSDPSLLRKLALVLALKLVLLLALWWLFVRDQGVTVDANNVAAQLLHAAPQPTQGTKQ